MTIFVDDDWWKHMFDEVYLLTDARSVCDPQITRREVDVICDILPLDSGHRILDLCGGHGRHSIELCARGFHRCTVLDYSEALLKEARREAGSQNYPLAVVKGDARDCGLAPETFDCVILMGNSMGYVREPGADRGIVAEAFRLLRPDGWLLLDVTDGRAVREKVSANAWHEIGSDTVVCRQRELVGDTIYAREMVLSRKNGLVRDGAYAIRLYDASDLQRLLEQNRFADVQVHTEFSPHGREGDFGCMNHRMVAVGRKPCLKLSGRRPDSCRTAIDAA